MMAYVTGNGENIIIIISNNMILKVGKHSHTTEKNTIELLTH